MVAPRCCPVMSSISAVSRPRCCSDPLRESQPPHDGRGRLLPEGNRQLWSFRAGEELLARQACPLISEELWSHSAFRLERATQAIINTLQVRAASLALTRLLRRMIHLPKTICLRVNGCGFCVITVYLALAYSTAQRVGSSVVVLLRPLMMSSLLRAPHHQHAAGRSERSPLC